MAGSAAPEGVDRSTDGAESWEPVALPKNVRSPNSLAPDPDDPTRLYLSLWSDVAVGDYRGTRAANGKDVESSEGAAHERG